MTHPTRLLHGVYWCCEPRRYPDVSVFLDELITYQLDLGREDRMPTWDEVVLSVSEVKVGFECWIDEVEHEVYIDVLADDGVSFTRQELMHKICDGIGAYLITHNAGLFDHKFFEGIRLDSATAEATAPTYFVSLGS